MEFHETYEIHHFHQYQVPLDSNGIFHEISWNFVAKLGVIKFHEIPSNLLIAYLNDIRFPWTAMVFL